MNWVSGADLTAAVSRAGGLGTLGPNAGADDIIPDIEITGERLRSQIRRVKAVTEKPFAVNIAIGFGGTLDYSKKCVDVVLEEVVPAAITSVGRPDVYTEVLHNAGIKVLHAISTARHAKKAEEAGVDAVICEGFEAGGHKGFTELTTIVLAPMVADAVEIPVIAGGGIADARGALAALALGADGIYMGTRFMVTRESESHARVKECVVRGEDACTVTLPKDIMLARDFDNVFTKKYLEMKAAGATPQELNDFLDEHSQYRAQHLGDAEDAEICCGQAVGLIKGVDGAQEVVREIAGSMNSRFEELRQKLADFL
jgi:NAD(P)H-dependent flavin oxidoreductase YrpB (nitropropane dioxygenase family)